ncbi:MFS transporter, partial [Streptomyces sp. NPDC059468]
DYDSSTPIALYVIAAAVLTLIAVGVARETRHRDLAQVEAGDGDQTAVSAAADARTV